MSTADNLRGPPWLDVARSLRGEREIKGPKHNSKILRMWDAIRTAWIRDDETPWCAGFVGFCLEEVGIRSTRSAAALSYRNFGVRLDRPAVGAIAVKQRKGGGHVTFIIGRDRWGHLMCLGGNQDDAVRISPYSPSAFTGFRWPSIRPLDHRYDLPLLLGDGSAPPSEA